MPLVEKIQSKAGVIGIWRLSETTDELLPQVTLNSAEQDKLSQLKLAQRQKEFLASRILLNKLSGKELSISYTSAGKPFLKDSDYNISISHSANFASVFLSKQKIGIDIEQHTRNVDQVSKRFLHEDEASFIQTLEDQQFARILFWSAKEAIFKCSDSQGIQFNKQILIDPFPIKTKKQFSAKLSLPLKIVKYQLYYHTIENNVLVYCVEE